MTTPTFHDLELLSAHLDGQLSPDQARRLDARLATDKELAAARGELSFTRALLRRTPRRRIPHNFTLKPKMAGLRAPLPRLVPAFSWASAAAMLIFLCMAGTSLVKNLSFGAAAPMMMSAPAGMGGGGGAEDENLTGMAATEPPMAESYALTTATPEAPMLTAPQPLPDEGERGVPPEESAAKESASTGPWYSVWIGLAVLFSTIALLLRWRSQRAFKRSLNQK